MRYLKAIIHTVLLVLMPLITIPLMQWYERTFLEPKTDIIGVYMLLFLISLGMLAITIVKWIEALNGKDFKDL